VEVALVGHVERGQLTVQRRAADEVDDAHQVARRVGDRDPLHEARRTLHGLQEVGLLLWVAPALHLEAGHVRRELLVEHELDDLRRAGGEVQGELDRELGLVLDAEASLLGVAHDEVVVVRQAQHRSTVDRHVGRGVFEDLDLAVDLAVGQVLDALLELGRILEDHP